MECSIMKVTSDLRNSHLSRFSIKKYIILYFGSMSGLHGQVVLSIS